MFEVKRARVCVLVQVQDVRGVAAPQPQLRDLLVHGDVGAEAAHRRPGRLREVQPAADESHLPEGCPRRVEQLHAAELLECRKPVRCAQLSSARFVA